MSRRYLATLAAAAALVLLGGLLLRRMLDDHEPRAAAPPSEATAFQQLSQEALLRRLAAFLAERAADDTAFVSFRPELGATAVRMPDGALVTTTPTRAVVALPTPADTSAAPALAVDTADGGWVLVVGRRADDRVVSATGLAGGRAPTSCDGMAAEEIVLGVPLHDALAGAGLFTIGGRLRGVVVRCAGRLVPLTATSVARLLADSAANGDATLGVSVTPLDAVAAAYFAADSGLLVTETRVDGAAAALGVRPGDVLLAVDTVAVHRAADLRVVSRPTSLRVWRGGRAVTLRAAPADTGGVLGLTLAGGASVGAGRRARGVLVDDVRPGTPAHAAGLRAGDRVLRVGAADVTSPAVARRLLAAPRPLFLVVARDSVDRGVWLGR